MQRVAFIVDDGNQAACLLKKRLERQGWKVCRGSLTSEQQEDCYPVDLSSEKSFQNAAEQIRQRYGALDLLIHLFDPERTAEHACNDARKKAALSCFDCFALGQVRSVNAFYDLLKKGGMREICWLTVVDASQNAYRAGVRDLQMAAASLNMAAAITFNQLRKEGFIFRLYAASESDWKNAEALSAKLELLYLTDRFADEHNPDRRAELMLYKQDICGRVIPW